MTQKLLTLASILWLISCSDAGQLQRRGLFEQPGSVGERRQ